MTMTVYHLGRTGEIAGGMTQVINDYLQWTFPGSSQKLIVSRGSGALATARLFFSARSSISRLSATAPNVVVAHLSQGGSFLREGALAILARRRGLAVVAQVHGSSFAAFSARHPMLTRLVLMRAHVIHVLSDETREAVIALGVPGEIVLIPNGVAPSPTPLKENLVVFGGAVTRRKGADVLLRAWQSLDQIGDWRLVLAGPHREPDIVSSLPEGATAPGALPRDELRELLSRARIAVLPSVDEAMPLFILEALASSAAVVATPVGGIPAVIDETTGRLIPVGDADSLASALADLMTDAATRDRLGAAGFARWNSTYSAAAVVPQLEAAWMRALALRD